MEMNVHSTSSPSLPPGRARAWGWERRGPDIGRSDDASSSVNCGVTFVESSRLNAWRGFGVTLAQPLGVAFPHPHTCPSWEMVTDQNRGQASRRRPARQLALGLPPPRLG